MGAGYGKQDKIDLIYKVWICRAATEAVTLRRVAGFLGGGAEYGNVIQRRLTARWRVTTLERSRPPNRCGEDVTKSSAGSEYSNEMSSTAHNAFASWEYTIALQAAILRNTA